jgi:hypothetical protein
MREERARIVAAALVALVALAGGVVIGRASATTATASPAVTIVGGIPVGTADTPAGALAAADNYLAIGSQSVEQNPSLFARLVAAAYASGARARTLAQAATLRTADTTDMANYRGGGHAVAVIAARRLDSFTRTRAKVTSWLGGFVWGPSLQPRQGWNLVNTALAFRRGRWLVVSSVALDTPAPVPSIVFVDGENNRSSVFDTRLAGMTAPFYGAG